MSIGSIELYERMRATDPAPTHQDGSFPMHPEGTRREPVWVPEDIAEPEPWALESFGDLLSHQML